MDADVAALMKEMRMEINETGSHDAVGSIYDVIGFHIAVRRRNVTAHDGDIPDLVHILCRIDDTAVSDYIICFNCLKTSCLMKKAG